MSFGLPSVMVPVLSRTAIETLPVSSSEVAVLNSIPFLAPFPDPTMMPTGVASPKAQGQDMTSTEIPLSRAYVNRFSPSTSPEFLTRSPSSIIQNTNTTKAMPMTIGTKTPDTLSARRAIGALVELASSTILTICDKVVSSPVLVTFMLTEPVWLIVPV